MHSGTDFFAAWSDTVYATGNGLVTKVRRNLGYGRQIKIEHCGDYYFQLFSFIQILGKRG